MSATVRLMGTLNPMKKFSNCSRLWPWNPKIHGNVPRFCPNKIFFILTLYTHRQSLDWPLISILTSQPIHEACSSSWKTSHMFSIYEKTVNCKTSQKVSFGSYWGSPTNPNWHWTYVIDPSCCKWMICVSESKWPVTQMAITRTPVDINFSLFFLSWVTLIDTFIPIYGSKFRIFIALEFR